MGFWDLLKREQPMAYFTPNVTYLGAEDLATQVNLGGLTPAQMWATQPHLRTVVSFVARNIAQLGLHSFERDGDDRLRDRTSPFAVTMRRPNTDQTAYDLVYSLVGDMQLYDRAYWLVLRDADGPSGYMLRRLPPSWVTPIPRDAFGAGAYTVAPPNGKAPIDIPADDILDFTGYHPSNPRRGSPTVEALKETLSEQIEAAKYRGQVWKRGGRVSSVLKRPKDAPKWSDGAREQFREDWYAKFTGNGSKAGGTPILEDGMELERVDFSASEQQFVEAAKLSFATVAAAFHVNPTMVGILDNANYSNVREFRRMLYGDTLGPLIAQIEDRLNTFLLPRLGMDNANHYAEFNIAEKLQGSFEEQAKVMQTLVGAPLMTRDEGRGKFNLPAMGGEAATLITPLNVLTGGQASPTDSGSQNLDPKARHEALTATLSAFLARQGKSVQSAIGAGREWDSQRWDSELADDLESVQIDRTTAERLASAINETTRKAVDTPGIFAASRANQLAADLFPTPEEG